MQPDEDLNRSKPVVAIGLSRVVSLLLVLILIYSDLCFYSSYCVLIFYFSILGLICIDEFLARVFSTKPGFV